ncbi:Maestro heat-like repeat-containing protein family member 7 [Aix galericulata]|nr:Maestro heat-like repeat-containing protein family member 7 [Aix galericulata]
MQAALWCHKRQLKKVVQRGLLPLFFHLSDQTQSVAEASLEALVTAADFLKQEKLKHLAQTEQTWRIAECLLVQDKRKVEEYLQQSLPYLQHTQVALREAAIRFIGLAAQHCKDQSERKIHEICSFLQPLQNDEEETVVSLATQTIFILTRPREQLTQSWCRRALCCCLS